MKKASKKLLSLFLAVVMIITSCSVGFTAFAQDTAADSYWSDGSDAEAAFGSLNDLVDAYVPALLNIDAIKKILEDNLGMTVDENTTISDVVVGASPLLAGLLGGSGNKDEIRGDNSPLADTYFAYLEDDDAVMNFYSLYAFCEKNQGESGELGDYCRETFPKLKALLGKYGEATEEFVTAQAKGQAALEELGSYIYADETINDVYGGDTMSVPLSVFENIDVDGTKLKDLDMEPYQGFADYMNGQLKAAGANLEVKTVADLACILFGSNQTQYITETYLGMALLSGIPLEYEGITFTMENYADICAEMYTLDQFCQENYGASAADLEAGDPDAYKMVSEMYESIMIPSTMLSLLVDMDTMDASASPFYYQMCVGILKYSGLFNDESLKALEVTDEQINAFVDYAKANFNEGTIGGVTNVDTDKFVAYITSNECPFSNPVKKVLKSISNPVEFQRLATDGKVEELKNYKWTFGTSVDDKDMSVFEVANFLIPSILITENISSEETAQNINEVYGSFTAINTYKENIAPKTAEFAYDYDDYAINPDLMVNYVNDTLNGLLNEYLAPGAMIAGLIDLNQILNSLLETNISLYNGDGTGALDDLWLNLATQPVETIFKLLPVLVVLVDEVVLPVLLNGEGDVSGLPDLYAYLTGEDSPITPYTQKAKAVDGVYVGIGGISFDLNKALPSILHWITGDQDYTYDTVVKYDSEGADADYYANLKAYCDANVDEEGNRLTYDGGFNSIPKFLNIYAADKAIYKFNLSQLEDIFKNGGMDANLAKGLSEAITELATFAMEAIDEYLDEHATDKRYGVGYAEDITTTQKGLNNIFVALPQLIDTIGKKFVDKYGIDSDWTYCYEGKFVEVEKEFRNGTVTQVNNATLQAFKDSKTADEVLGNFVNILIGNWVNAILDIVNDTVADKDNTISNDLEIVNDLLNALGGFGEKSIITDLVNGFFSLTRKDDASFTLSEQETTGFNGFNVASGFFLLTNIQYKDENGKEKGIIPFIKALATSDDSSSEDSAAVSSLLSDVQTVAKFAPLLASSKSAAGTDYSKLLTKKNIAAADELVGKLDSILSSLLKNTSINGFDLTSTDSILSGAVSFVSNYIGADATNDLLTLVDAYVECIVGENAEGPINANKVYTSKNLSNLVVETYTLIEKIADKLLVNALGKPEASIIADAICGIVSPDSVGIRMTEDYKDTAKILVNGHKSWTELAGKNLDFGFSAGDKEGFYDALGESVNGIATVVGFLLTNISSADGKNFYSELVQPILAQLADATGATGVMSAADFNAATDAQKLIKGIVTPVGNILAKLYNKPATFLVNVIQGLAGVLEDTQINAILTGVVAPVNGIVDKTIAGVVDLVSNLSPTLADFLDSTINGAIGGIKVTINGNEQALFPIDIKNMFGIGDKDVVVTLINSLLPASVAEMIKLPSIDWAKLNKAKTAGEALLLAYGYIVDTALGSALITNLLDSVDENIANIVKNLSAAQLLQILNDVLDVATTPTEIYWTFSEYASKVTGTFTYPKDVTSKDANKAVKELDEIVNGVLPLLTDLGIDLGADSLSGLVYDNLFTNENLTTLAVTIYGAIDNGINGIEDKTVRNLVNELLATLGFDFSTKGIAKLMTNKAYGEQFTTVADAIKTKKNWNQVKTINWGFKNGSKMAKQGFVNGLAAILRPLDDIVAIFTANNALNLDLAKFKPALTELLNTLSVETALGEVGTLTIANGQLTIVITGDKASTIKVDIATLVSDVLAAFGKTDLYLGSNGYESAIVPLLEAFMIDDLKTYKQYTADIKKAKDNVLLDILNPIVGLVDDVLANPVATVASILPNLAYFIDNNGLTQAVGNLLAPILSTKGVLGALAKNGLDVDKLIKAILGKDLGSVVADLIGTDVKLNIELMHLEKCNIQDIVIPLVSGLLNDLLGIKLPELTLEKIASLGTLKAYKSAARNDKGTFDAKHVVADNGKVLIGVLRFVAQILIDNTAVISDLLNGIDAIKNNKTISNVIAAVLGQLKSATKDDIVRAIFYFLTENATTAYWDYSKYEEKDYSFSYGDIDAGFMSDLAAIVDGSIGQIFSLLGELGVADIESIKSLVDGNLYKNDLIAKLATGLYGAIEGVEISKEIGSLAELLAKTDIDFTAKGVANMLTDKSYGKTYSKVAATIKKAGSWKKVDASKLDFGVTDRDSFLEALCAVLRPVYGVLDVIFNEGSLGIFNLVSIPGSNGYENTLVPILEALGVTGLKTKVELKADAKKAYDNILLDVLVPVFDWLETIMDAPVQTIASILPNIGLFIANDGLIQAIDNLLTPVSALLKAIKPIVDVNKVIKALGVDLNKTLGDLLKKANIKAKLDIDVYNLPKTLKPLIGQENIVPLLNSVLGLIKVSGKPLAIKIPNIDWFELASHGEYKTLPSAALNTEGRYDREAVIGNVGETLLAVLRFVETLLIDNADAISDLLGNIDAIKKNATILNILKSVFGQISKATMDDVVKAVLYFFEGRSTDKFFDFSEFKYNESNDFAWGELDQEFCETLPPMLDGLVSGLLEEKGGLLGLITDLVYKDDLVSKIATGLYGAIEGVELGSIGSLANILKLVGIDFTTANVADLLTDEAYGTKYEANAAKIKAAGSWKNVKPESLSWGVTDRDSFVSALCAVLRPIYGVLDVLLNDGLLNLYDIVSVPGSDGYTSTIVPLLEAFSCYNVKTQYQYREDMSKEYDAILKDVLNPLLDKVEDLLNAPVETLASMLPNLSLFFANDGLLQVIDNLLAPISALLGALQPIVDVNEVLDAAGLDLNAIIAKAGLKLNINLDIYDLKGTLQPVIGADNVVALINNILGIIKIKGTPLGLELPEIDWLKLAAHGDLVKTGSSVVASNGPRYYVVADSAAQEAEVLIAVLRFVVNTVNYKNNYQTIVDLIGGLIGGGEEGGISDVIGTVLGMLQGEADSVILELVDLLKSFS